MEKTSRSCASGVIWKIAMVVAVLVIVGLSIGTKMGNPSANTKMTRPAKERNFVQSDANPGSATEKENQDVRKQELALWEVDDEEVFRSDIASTIIRHREAISVEDLVNEWKLARSQKNMKIEVVTDWHTGFYGGGGGGYFHYNWGGRMHNPGVHRFCVRSGAVIDRIDLFFQNGYRLQRGGGGGGYHCAHINRGDCYSEVWLRSGRLVDAIRVRSSNNHWFPHWGGGGGGAHHINSRGRCLQGVRGRSGSKLDAISFWFGYFCPAGFDCSRYHYAHRRACNPGYYGTYTWGRLGCASAAPGHYSHRQWGHQARCPIGQYNPLWRQSRCRGASPGYFVSGTGWTRQNPCGVGWYQNHGSQRACKRASPGHYVARTAQAHQQRCPPGTYQPGHGASGCANCPVGHFQPLWAQTRCVRASRGHYVRHVRQSRQIRCNPGFYQPNEGQTGCIVCPKGTYSIAHAQSSCPPARTTVKPTVQCGFNGIFTLPPGHNFQMDLRIGKKPLAFLGISTCHSQTRKLVDMEFQDKNQLTAKQIWRVQNNCVSRTFVDVFQRSTKPVGLLQDYVMKFIYDQSQSPQVFRLTITCQVERPLFCGDTVMGTINAQLPMRKYALATGTQPISKLTLTTCYPETRMDTKIEIFQRGSRNAVRRYDHGCGNKAQAVVDGITTSSSPISLGNKQDAGISGQTSGVHGHFRVGLVCCFANDVARLKIAYASGLQSIKVWLDLTSASSRGQVVKNVLGNVHSLRWASTPSNSNGAVLISTSQRGVISGSQNLDVRASADFTLLLRVRFPHTRSQSLTWDKPGTRSLVAQATWQSNALRLTVRLGACSFPTRVITRNQEVTITVTSSGGNKQVVGYVNGARLGDCTTGEMHMRSEDMAIVGLGGVVLMDAMYLSTTLGDVDLRKPFDMVRQEVTNKVVHPNRHKKEHQFLTNIGSEDRLRLAPCPEPVTPRLARTVMLPRSGKSCGPDIYVFKDAVMKPANVFDVFEVIGVSITIKFTLIRDALVGASHTNSVDVDLALMDDTMYDQKSGIPIGHVALGGTFHAFADGSRTCCCRASILRSVSFENRMQSMKIGGPVYLVAKVSSSVDGLFVGIQSISGKLTYYQHQSKPIEPITRHDIILYRGPTLTDRATTMVCPQGYFVSYISSYASSPPSDSAIPRPTFVFGFKTIVNGNTAKDCVTGRTLTWNHGVTLAAGSGKAIQNGNNIIAPISNTESIVFTKATSYTVFLEYSTRDVTSDYWYFLFGKMGATAYPRDMTLWTNPKRMELTFAVRNNDYQCRGFLPSSYVRDRNYNIAFVYDSSTGIPQFYVDGMALRQSCGRVSAESVTRNKIYVGGDPSRGHSRGFPGTFYRVMLFPNKMSASSVRAIGKRQIPWLASLERGCGSKKHLLKVQCEKWHEPQSNQIELTLDVDAKTVTSASVSPPDAKDPQAMLDKGMLGCRAGLVVQGYQVVRARGTNPVMKGVGQFLLGMGCQGDYGYAQSVVTGNPPSSTFTNAQERVHLCLAGLRPCGMYVYVHPVFKTPIGLGVICCNYVKYKTRSEQNERLFVYASADKTCADGLKRLANVNNKERLRLLMTLSDFVKQDLVIGGSFDMKTSKFLSGKDDIFSCQIPQRGVRRRSADIAQGDVLVYKYAANGRSHLTSWKANDPILSKSKYICLAKSARLYDSGKSVDFTNALKTCKTDHNRHMLKITNENEDWEARRACKLAKSAKQCWLGLRWSAEGNQWMWNDGSALVYHHFDVREKKKKDRFGNYTLVKTYDPMTFAPDQCAVMKNDNHGFWYATPCTQKAQVLCGPMKYQISRGDINERTMQMSCAPNLNAYLQEEPLTLSFVTCTKKWVPLVMEDLISHVTISISTSDGGYYVLTPQTRTYAKKTANWHQYSIEGKIDYLALRKMRNNISMIAFEAIDVSTKKGVPRFMCFEKMELVLFGRKMALPPTSATDKASHLYIKKFALGPDCKKEMNSYGPSEYFVQIEDGYNEMVHCSEKVFFSPTTSVLNFFEVGIESCAMEDKDIDSYTINKLKLKLTGSNRGKDANGNKVTTFHGLNEMKMKNVGPNTIWQRGETYKYFYHGRAATLDFIAVTNLSYFDATHEVEIKYKFCKDLNRIPPGAEEPGKTELAESTVKVNAEFDFKRLRSTKTKVFLVLYGTHDRKEEKEIDVEDLYSNEEGSFKFIKTIGRVQGVGFETPRKDMSGAFGCIEKLKIRYSNQKDFIDISHVIHDREYIGNSGYFDEQSQRFVQKYLFPKNHPSIKKISRELGSLCLSKMSVTSTTGEKRFGRLFSNEVGSCRGCVPSVNAYIEYPVCKIKISNCQWNKVSSGRSAPNETLSKGSPKEESLFGDRDLKFKNPEISSICVNKQRFLYSECQVNRAVSVTWTKTKSNHNFSTSMATDKNHEVDEGTISGNRDTHWGFGAEVGVELSFDTDIKPFGSGSGFGFSIPVTLSPSGGGNIVGETQVTNTRDISSTMLVDSRWDKTMTYSHARTSTIDCAGKMMVPPSQSVSYTLKILSNRPIKYELTCDHELILCTSVVSKDEFPPSIKIKNVHVQFHTRTMPLCEVEFDRPKLITNTMTCRDEQKIAWASGSTFAPNCVVGNMQVYEPCQCVMSTQTSPGMCACFTRDGNVDPNKGIMSILPGKSATDTCRMLGCITSAAKFPH